MSADFLAVLFFMCIFPLITILIQFGDNTYTRSILFGYLVVGSIYLMYRKHRENIHLINRREDEK